MYVHSLSLATVLVVEDNPDNRFLLTDLLEHECRVRACLAVAAGWQAFLLLKEQPTLIIDLILLDIQLPAQNGFSVLQRMREMPMLRTTPVIAVTANTLPTDVARYRVAGFNSFLGKPLNMQRFPGQIQRIFAGEALWESN